MTDTRDDPRYTRTVGLTLLAALLVVASCEVERPATVVMDATVVLASPPVVRVEPPTTQGDPAASDVESIQDAIRTLRAADPGDVAPSQAEPQEIRPEEVAAIQAGPVFTPMTVRPDLRNRGEVQQALMRNYPVALRDAGVGGTVVVWVYISETGQVLHSRIDESSGQALLDDAALRVANVFQFTPALLREDPVPVWIHLPITFQVL